MVQKNFGYENIWVYQNFGQKKLDSKMFLVQINLGLQNYWVQKSPLHIWHLIDNPPEIYIYTLVKIAAVNTEILLIWTTVVRSNVAWANDTETVNICSGVNIFRNVRNFSWMAISTNRNSSRK